MKRQALIKSVLLVSIIMGSCQLTAMSNGFTLDQKVVMQSLIIDLCQTQALLTRLDNCDLSTIRPTHRALISSIKRIFESTEQRLFQEESTPQNLTTALSKLIGVHNMSDLTHGYDHLTTKQLATELTNVTLSLQQTTREIEQERFLTLDLHTEISKLGNAVGAARKSISLEIVFEKETK